MPQQLCHPGRLARQLGELRGQIILAGTFQLTAEYCWYLYGGLRLAESGGTFKLPSTAACHAGHGRLAGAGRLTRIPSCFSLKVLLGPEVANRHDRSASESPSHTGWCTHRGPAASRTSLAGSYLIWHSRRCQMQGHYPSLIRGLEDFLRVTWHSSTPAIMMGP